MTNPFEPPRKRAFDDAELALAIEQSKDAIAAMEILESQAKLRSEDAQAYVAWVRQMEGDGSAEAKAALTAARRQQAGLPASEEVVEEEIRDENSWQKLIPDWQERQEAQLRATEDAVEQARAEANARLEAERDSAVAAAIAQAEAEAELARNEAIERVRAEAAAKLRAELAAAEEAAQLQAEREAEVLRVENERLAEEKRIEAERASEEARIEAERIASEEQAELERSAELERLAEAERVEAERIELEREEAERLSYMAEPAPVAAAGFATGSFDIVESAEQSADDEEDNFDYLMTDGELPFAREPKSSSIDKPLSTISRRSKAISQLFIWGGLTVGVAPLLLAAYVSHLRSVGDGIVAIAIGLVFSSAIISVAAIAGKRSGLSTLILARAAFGVHGNLVSAIPLVIAKLGFGAVLFYLAIGAFDGTIEGLPALTDSPVSASPQLSLQVLALACVLLVSGVLAYFGGKVLYWAQLSSAAIGALVVIGFIAVTAGQLRLDALIFEVSPDFIQLVIVSAVVGIFFGAFWITAVAEFTRKIPMSESGKKVSLYVALATGLLPLLVSSYGLVALKSSLKQGSIQTIVSPLDEVMRILPNWAATAVLYSAIVTLIVWAASWMYATSVSFAAVGAKLRPFISQPIILLIAILLAVYLTPVFNSSFVAVVILSWAGIFVGDVAIRRIAYHEVSLARDYGFYRAWNWVNIGGFVVAAIVGFGLIGNVEGPWSWLGFISDDYLTLGIYVAPLTSFLFPILFGRKRIKLQEQEVLKIEARRHDLADVNAE